MTIILYGECTKNIWEDLIQTLIWDFLEKILWENKWTPSVHNQVFQELFKDPIEIFDMGFLGIDSFVK